MHSGAQHRGPEVRSAHASHAKRHLWCTARRRERPEVRSTHASHVKRHLWCTARRRERPKVRSAHASHVERHLRSTASFPRKHTYLQTRTDMTWIAIKIRPQIPRNSRTLHAKCDFWNANWKDRFRNANAHKEQGAVNLAHPRRAGGGLARAAALRVNWRKLRTGDQLSAKVATARRRHRWLVQA